MSHNWQPLINPGTPDRILFMAKELFKHFGSVELQSIERALIKTPSLPTDLKPIKEETIYIESIHPNYSAEILLFLEKGISLLYVRDHFGEYLYRWPDSCKRLEDSSTVSIASTNSLKKLET